jgi:hypothetical protein
LGYRELALAVSLAGTAANALMLASFRQPERPIGVTAADVGRAWLGWGAGAGVLVAVAAKVRRK